MSEIVLPIFSLGVLWCYVLYLSLSHFEFICVCVLWECVLTLLTYMRLSSFPNIICWSDCLYGRLIDHRYMGLFLCSLFCSIDHVCFCAVLDFSDMTTVWRRKMPVLSVDTLRCSAIALKSWSTLYLQGCQDLEAIGLFWGEWRQRGMASCESLTWPGPILTETHGT